MLSKARCLACCPDDEDEWERTLNTYPLAGRDVGGPRFQGLKPLAESSNPFGA